MLSLSLNTRQKRAWLLGGYRTDIDLSLSPKDSTEQNVIPVAALFDGILRASPNCLMVLEQAEVRNDSGETLHIVKNLRGRPDVLQKNESSAAKGEEIFYSTGIVKAPPLSKNETQSKDAKDIPFEFEVRSEFSQFGQHSIEHKLVGNSSSVLKPVVDEFEIHMLPKLIPAEVHYIRFGIEHFKQSLYGGLASFSGPSVHQRFFLEISRSKIDVKIQQEYGCRLGEVPQFEGNLIGPLDYALDSLELYVGLGNTILSDL